MGVKIVYVDLDGVCADLLGGLYATMGKPYPPALWPRTNADATAQFRLCGKALWEEVERRNESFWSDLSEYPWFKELWNSLSQVARPVVLTSPSATARSVAGKIEWMRKRFGDSFQDYIITSRKADLSAPNRCLIDDSPENIANFREQGGVGILFPQPWNTPNPNPCRFVNNREWLQYF